MIARELGVDLTKVKGTGEKGRITKEDVKRAVAGGAPAVSGGSGIPEIPPQDFAKFGAIDERPLSRLKKLSAPHLHRARLNIPHVTHTDEADITELEDYRKSLDKTAKDKGYYELMKRRGVSQAMARAQMRSRMSLMAAMYLRRGYVDAMLCGMRGTYEEHLTHVQNVIGTRAGTTTLAAMNMLMLPDRQLFICDTYVNRNPTAEQLVEMTLLAAEEVRRFGLVPSVALLSESSFGSSSSWDARTMRDAVAMLNERAPELEVEGEMRGDAALSPAVLKEVMPDARLSRGANLLMMPNVDAANIAYNLLKVAASNGITVGPILLGASKPVHILEPTASVRRIVNMTALAVVDVAAESR